VRTPEKNTQTNVLSYTVTIVERGRAYIENIIIVGNERTRTDVILREIPMEPGDVFSKTKVMEAMRNLYNLQFFSMIFPDTLPGSAENLMDLVFNVEEQMTTELQFGITFSGSADPDTFPISGLLKWNDRNVAGTGNQLGAEINSSVVDSLNLSLNYLHRWVLGLPLSLGVDFSAQMTNRWAPMANQHWWFHGDEPRAFPDGFSSFEEYVTRNRTPTRDYLMDYTQWYVSLGFSSGYRWLTRSGIFGINGGVRFGMLRNIFDTELFRPFEPALRAGGNEWTPRNSFSFTLSLDQRDIFFDPTRGYYLFQRVGFFGLLPDEREHFLRTDTRAQYFHTLLNIPVSENWSFRCIFAFHIGLSAIIEQPFLNRELEVADVSRLAVDGMFIGRGWGEEFRNKGYLLLDSWVELRFPLVRGLLAFDLFFDAAGVETEQGLYFDNQNFRLQNLRFSYGGGLRFTIPQFPIRLSMAKRFKIDENYGIDWQRGALFHNSDRPTSGLDLVVSFAISF
jgi:outer membrane protein insertion porin family